MDKYAERFYRILWKMSSERESRNVGVELRALTYEAQDLSCVKREV